MSTEFTLYKKDHETQAKHALDEAQKKAQEIIASTQLFSSDMKKSVADAINKSVANGTSTYDQLISEMGDKSAKELLTYSDSLKKMVQGEASSLTNSFKDQLQNEEQAFHQTLEQSQAEILEEVKKKASALLSDVVKDAVKKSITVEESEELILSSLQKIKKQHGFS